MQFCAICARRLPATIASLCWGGLNLIMFYIDYGSEDEQENAPSARNARSKRAVSNSRE